MPKFEPGWALWFGFLVAPIISTLNARLLRVLVGNFQFYPRFFVDLIQSCFWAAIFTVPLGFITARALEIWNRGDRAKARTLGVCFGLFSIAFWIWLGDSLIAQKSLSAETIAALLLPFLWSLLVPLFALFARPSRESR